MAEDATVFDVAVVGYGPAGITAAIYSARKRLKVALVGGIPGGEVVNSGEIENWPGGGATDGIALADQMVKHLQSHTDMVTITQDLAETVTRGSDGLFELSTVNDKTIRSKTVVYATGRHPRKLGVPGEDEFKNRGVSYCATCDAPLFQDKTVAVVGGGNTGAEAVIMFQKIAKKIYLLHLGDALTADPILTENFLNDPKVEVVYSAKTLSIAGDVMVEKLTYEDEAQGQEKTLPVEGVFITIGAVPNTDPVKELVSLDTYGAVVADRYGTTTVEGFFAAGDVTDIRDAQIVVAAGHGCSAALSAGDYLSRKRP